jgi:hypothetical protein
MRTVGSMASCPAAADFSLHQPYFIADRRATGSAPPPAALTACSHSVISLFQNGVLAQGQVLSYPGSLGSHEREATPVPPVEPDTRMADITLKGNTSGEMI